MDLFALTSRLRDSVDSLAFSPPVTCVYHPLSYARLPYEAYVRRYGGGRKEAVLIGMNPGPWGMVQTGVPFGEVAAVRDWMGIREPVEQPENVHRKRPVQGFDCPRSEVSGRRLWGWARDRFGAPEAFFARFFVLNYCPLSFMEESGKNRTPDKLPASERDALFEVCDKALRHTVEAMAPGLVIGVGAFAEKRARTALDGLSYPIGRITHPSPANPKANRGWAPIVERELAELGVPI